MKTEKEIIIEYLKNEIEKRQQLIDSAPNFSVKESYRQEKFVIESMLEDVNN